MIQLNKFLQELKESLLVLILQFYAIIIYSRVVPDI